jgi:hypothetical protein
MCPRVDFRFTIFYGTLEISELGGSAQILGTPNRAENKLNQKTIAFITA